MSCLKDDIKIHVFCRQTISYNTPTTRHSTGNTDDDMKVQVGGLLPCSPNYSSFDEDEGELEDKIAKDFDVEEDPSHKNKGKMATNRD